MDLGSFDSCTFTTTVIQQLGTTKKTLPVILKCVFFVTCGTSFFFLALKGTLELYCRPNWLLKLILGSTWLTLEFLPSHRRLFSWVHPDTLRTWMSKQTHQDPSKIQLNRERERVFCHWRSCSARAQAHVLLLSRQEILPGEQFKQLPVALVQIACDCGCSRTWFRLLLNYSSQGTPTGLRVVFLNYSNRYIAILSIFNNVWEKIKCISTEALFFWVKNLGSADL